jgi:hypothetical protein
MGLHFLVVSAEVGENIKSCTGYLVVYHCSIPSLGHTWIVPAIKVIRDITLGLRAFSSSQYCTKLLGNSDDSLNTSLSVLSFMEFNGTSVECRDALVQINESERRQTTALVYGKSCSFTLALYLDLFGLAGLRGFIRLRILCSKV